MPLKFIDLNSPPIVSVKCNNQKIWRKKNGTQRDLKNQKIDNTENDSNAYE